MRTLSIITTLMSLLLISTLGFSADTIAKNPEKPIHSNILEYKVINGDTIYLSTIPPAIILSNTNRSKKEWRKYYKLVYNFGKTYPYALMARVIVNQIDSTFEKDSLSKRDQKKYINSVQKELFKAFEKPMKDMTISQGQLLMKLVDREVGTSSYNLIKQYKSGIAAGFWQGVAKIFGNDLKKHYDPKGKDKDIEELVEIWNDGNYPYLYLTIFGELPNIPEIPSKYRK